MSVFQLIDELLAFESFQTGAQAPMLQLLTH